MLTKLVGLLVILAIVPVSLDRQDSQDPGAIALGKKVFEGKSGGAICFTCHGMNAKGTPGLGPR